MISFDLDWSVWGLAIAFVLEKGDKGLVFIVGPLAIFIPGR